MDNFREQMYYKWKALKKRCNYNKEEVQSDSRKIHYYGCKCSDEWNSFDNFYQWCIDNYWEYKDERMCVDKDLLVPNNKLYSQDTCVFLPNLFNVAINVKKNSEYGLCGVYKRNYVIKCWIGRLQCGEKTIRKGFYTPLEAQEWYIVEKNNYIHQLAEDNKELIPQKVYDAMIKYDVRELIEIPQWVYEYKRVGY